MVLFTHFSLINVFLFVSIEITFSYEEVAVTTTAVMHCKYRCLSAAFLLLAVATINPGRAEHGKNTCCVIIFIRYYFVLEIADIWHTWKNTQVPTYVAVYVIHQ